MARRNGKDDVDHFHDYGIHMPTRTIYVGSEFAGDEGESGVDAFMTDKLIKNLRVLDTLNSDPITILMNNVGGDVYHGLAIFDAIRECKSHVTIKVFGHAMSMGSIILQAADSRIMSPNSYQMIHYGSLSYSGHSLTSIKWANQEKLLNAKMERLYLAKIQEKNPKFTLKQLKAMLDHDTFLTAEESVALGLADGVLETADAKT